MLHRSTTVNLHYTTDRFCPLCSSELSRVMYTAPTRCSEVSNFFYRYYKVSPDEVLLPDDHFSIHKCLKCSSFYQKKIFDEKSAKYLYDSLCNAKKSLLKRERADFRYFVNILAFGKNLKRYFGRRILPADIRVLDFGMGWGFWARGMAALGFSVQGCELSQERSEYAGRMGVVNVELNELVGVYDVINMEQVLEHLPEPMAMINELVKRLQVGGVLIIGVPNGFRTRKSLHGGRWRPQKDALHPFEHLNLFNRKSFKRKLRDFGIVELPLWQYFVLRIQVRRIISSKLYGGCSGVYVKINNGSYGGDAAEESS